ncbi:ABC transporter ATP-binding protein [Treponema phagedenis]|uniref:ABC transporter ATP-binding protein n=1 Tax=Treponema phagedenis TaxID=162 RepID=UPI0001F642FC|nr:ABC transporter ATP-binding protein [Treponema phagedenis]EFW38900.1 ABC transporter, ATP-binding protein [Treponema phagedenis F0421]NVP23893.1 ABC transporter ATP-binding protein [Treponema phagedenis]QEJ93805.1 ABC transporter ATP-binding protein [Treponema phagedenis]QEK07342.1 ABC transporter ATP-binding protein [Treponema phagedenis]QKS91174.1 ABC transporter ATP-binding protein [Treponema phagedenis]
MEILRAENVTRFYGTKKRAIVGCKDISFSVQRGTVCGLLGLNGAGKSTLLNILSGYLLPSSGDAFINGFSVSDEPLQAKKHLGVLHEQIPLYADMTVQQFLLFTASIFSDDAEAIQESVERVIQYCALDEVQDRRIKGLSRGYKQRTGLAQALVHEPSLLILDEPTSGLDAMQVKDFHKKIRALPKETSVIISMHNLQEAERLCTYFVLLHEGSVLVQGSLDKIAERLTQDFPHLQKDIADASANGTLTAFAFEQYVQVSPKEFE